VARIGLEKGKRRPSANCRKSAGDGELVEQSYRVSFMLIGANR